MISLIAVLLSLVIWGLIFSILWWAIGVVGMSKVAVAILVIASVVIAIGLLMGSIAPFPFLALSGI